MERLKNLLICPTRPATELRQIKTQAAAATSFGLPHRKLSINGERKIPPPMPIIPDNNPRTAPTEKETKVEGLWTSSVADGDVSNKRIPAMIKLAHKMERNVFSVIENIPPMKAIGTEPETKGRINCLLK